MIFTIISNLQGAVRVGRLPVLYGNQEIGGGEIIGFVETKGRIIDVRV